MELARGTIADRPWGQTLGALGLRGLSGQLTLDADDGKRYAVAFERGAVVGASSPLPTDSILRVALTNHLISSTQVAEITRKLAAHADRDEVDVLVEATALSKDQAFRLRQRLIAQRAARTFAIDRASFAVSDEITIPHSLECAVDIRAIVYLGVRQNLSEQRLVEDLRALGAYFVLEPSAIADIPQFGFTSAEAPILEVLRTGTSLPELEAIHRELDPRTAQAVIYALVSCLACQVRAPDPAAAAVIVQRPPTPEDRPKPTRTSSPSFPPFVAPTTTGGIAITRSPTIPPRPSRTATPPADVQARTRTPSAEMQARTRAPSAEMQARTRTPSGTPQTHPSPPSPPPTTTPTITPSQLYAAPEEPQISRTQTPVEPWMTIGTPTTRGPVLPPTAPTETPQPAPEPQPQTQPRAHTPSSSPPVQARAPTPSAMPLTLPDGVDPVLEAAASFRRGQVALRREELEVAIMELLRASQIAPHDIDYAAMLAWAIFVAAQDKQAVAEETRKTLTKAIQRSPKPEVARFYLGRVERMLGRDKEALRHFNEILEEHPKHADAAAEKRIIELRMAAPDKPGLFGRKR